MSEFETKNAKIESTRLGFDRGVFLTLWLHLDYGGSGQGAGGYVLGKESDAKGEGCSIGVISALLGVVGVEKWEDLPGKHIRVTASMGKVKSIGNVLKDKWFHFDEIKDYLIENKPA